MRKTMKIRVQQMGDDIAVAIPSELATKTRFKRDDLVDAIVQEGRLIISPLEKRKPTLEELLAGVTEENLHGEWDTGPAVGAETW
jgi:antitoxin MazE